jgi:ribose transport system substrate-binding protein
MREMTRSFRIRGVVAVAVALALSVALSACGSDDDSSDASSTPASSTAATGGKDAAAWKAEAATLLDTDSFIWPKPVGAFAPGKGKIAIISCGEADAGCHTLTVGAQDAAKAAGWESKVFDTAFDPNKGGGFVQQAVQEGYDGIILGAINPTLIQSAVASATQAGIPIGCSVCVTPKTDQYADVMDATSGGAAGNAEAIGVIAASDAKAQAVYFYTPGQAIEVARTDALKAQFEQCADCKLTIREVPLGDLAKPGPPFFNGFLSSPLAKEVDWVTASSDAYSVPAMKTAIDQGITDYRFGGTAATADMTVAMTKPDAIAAVTVAESYSYASWAAVDNVIRKVRGAPTWDASALPVALVTPENAAKYAHGGQLEPPGGIAGVFVPLWTGA